IAPEDAEVLAADGIAAAFAEPVADHVGGGEFVNRPFRTLIPGFFKPATGNRLGIERHLCSRVAQFITNFQRLASIVAETCSHSARRLVMSLRRDSRMPAISMLSSAPGDWESACSKSAISTSRRLT